MTKLKLYEYPHPILKQKAEKVDKVDDELRRLLDDMLETMHAADGVGLAAPQVGVLRRLVVVEVEEGKPIFLINPEITYTSGEQEGTEGCLSVPGRAGVVLRPQKVTVKATGRDGKPLEITGTDLLARAFCHEIDHLDGKLYTDIALYMEDK